MYFFHKILGGMASSVKTDQTAHSGAFGSVIALFAYAVLSEKLVYVTVHFQKKGIFGKDFC